MHSSGQASSEGFKRAWAIHQVRAKTTRRQRCEGLELERDAGSSPKGALAQSESPAAGPQSTVMLLAQERCRKQKQEAVRR